MTDKAARQLIGSRTFSWSCSFCTKTANWTLIYIPSDIRRGPTTRKFCRYCVINRSGLNFYMDVSMKGPIHVDYCPSIMEKENPVARRGLLEFFIHYKRAQLGMECPATEE